MNPFFSIQATVVFSTRSKLNLFIYYTHTGSILVFLPGYDEIITLRDNLTADKEFGNTRR